MLRHCLVAGVLALLGTGSIGFASENTNNSYDNSALDEDEGEEAGENYVDEAVPTPAPTAKPKAAPVKKAPPPIKKAPTKMAPKGCAVIGAVKTKTFVDNKHKMYGDWTRKMKGKALDYKCFVSPVAATKSGFKKSP